MLRTISRRRAEGTLLELIYRKPPSPEPEREMSSIPEPKKRPKGSVAQELVQEEVTGWDASVKPELLVEFPTEEPVEDEVVDVPSKAELKKIEEDPECESAAKLQETVERWNEQVKCVKLLEDMTWLAELPDTPDNLDALRTIFENGMRYCRDFESRSLLPWSCDHWPLKPRVWLAEMERVLKVMQQRNQLPYWLRKPHDKNIREDAALSADGFTDPGNLVLDTFVHALRLWQYCDPSKTSMVLRQSAHDYGHKANRSSTGPVNLRGNIVEAMSRNLQHAGSKMPKHFKKEYDPYWWYWTPLMEQAPQDEPEPVWQPKRRRYWR